MNRSAGRGILIFFICILSVFLLLLIGLTFYLTIQKNQSLTATVPSAPEVPSTAAPQQTTAPAETTAPEVTTEPTTVPTEPQPQ